MLKSMTISELLGSEELRRHEFPVTAEKIFLAHAGDSPLPRRVADAVAKYATESTLGDQESIVYPALLERGRSVAAQLLGCDAAEVAFVGPTSLALSYMAAGIRLRKHDNVLIYFDDYPSNVYPWMALAEKGVEVRLMNTRGLGVIRPRDVIGQIDENTRVVALASCHFISGYRLEVDEIGQALRKRNILFSMDAIQTLGAFPTSMQYVDMLAADAHKWLLGPCGAGLMVVRKAIQDRITPPAYGWHNVRCPGFVAQEQIVFKESGQKFEAGTHNLLGIVGLVAAMEMLLELGVQNIADELLGKRAFLVPALQARGFQVQQADVPPANASAIISFRKPAMDMAALHSRLMDAGVITSLRTDRAGNAFIRLSPHFYNTMAELEHVMELLR